jgi:hypothetical protein
LNPVVLQTADFRTEIASPDGKRLNSKQNFFLSLADYIFLLFLEIVVLDGVNKKRLRSQERV